MRNLIVFNLVTLDGFFAGMDGDISWHNVDDEFQELANQASNSDKLNWFHPQHQVLSALGEWVWRSL